MSLSKRHMTAIGLIVKRRALKEHLDRSGMIWMSREQLQDIYELLGDALAIVDVGGKVQGLLGEALVEP